jgi:endonuclease III
MRKPDITQPPSPIARALLAFGATIHSYDLFPTVVPEAAAFATSDPYAFSIATCLDRGTKADIIWTIPFDMRSALGHLDPVRISTMSISQLGELFRRLPRRPRYVNDAPRTVTELTRIVVQKCGGDASRIWIGKSASQVKRTFISIYGVGPGIANMAVLLIERAFPVRFNDVDRPSMDIKPDVHTMRVLYRLGAPEMEAENAAIIAARRLNPSYPGELDAPLWLIGRRWCDRWTPRCTTCPVTKVCEKRLNGDHLRAHIDLSSETEPAEWWVRSQRPTDSGVPK